MLVVLEPEVNVAGVRDAKSSRYKIQETSMTTTPIVTLPMRSWPIISIEKVQ